MSTEPLVGVVTDYSSNPYLESSDPRPAYDVAVLLNAPTHYDSDCVSFALLPSIRYGTTSSYASLNSNSFHITSSAILSRDLDKLLVSAGIGRDSSLYQYGLSNNGVGVRADSAVAGVDWQRAITERLSTDVSANWSRDLYSQGADTAGLVDYHYSSFAASSAYGLTERNKLQASAGAGEYVSSNGVTTSKTYNLQLGFNRQLTELWTLAVSAGYAKSDNSVKIYEGPFLIGNIEVGPFLVGTFENQQKGGVYNTSVTHLGETVALTAAASRAYLPSGLGYLSRQDTATMDISYTVSERWKFSNEIKFQDITNPLSGGGGATARYYSALVSAEWHWTPTWVLSLHSIWTKSRYELPFVSAESTGVSVEISRQFLRIDL